MRVKCSLSIKVLTVLLPICALVSDMSPKAIRIMDGNALLFFTTQSNIAVAAVSLAGIVTFSFGYVTKKWMRIVKLATTTSIMLTMAVYCFLLAPAAMANAYDGVWSLSSILLHVVVPVLAIIDYLLCYKSERYDYVQRLWTIVPPVAFMTFSAIGYALKWDYGLNQNYPYFFMNYASEAGVFGFSKSLPYMGVAYYAIIIAASVYFFGMAITSGSLRREKI